MQFCASDFGINVLRNLLNYTRVIGYAIMLKGYVEAYNALENFHYLDLVEKNAQYFIKNQWSREGFLYRSYKNRKSIIEGFLEDYAFTIQAFISLYQATLKENYLHQAKQLTDYFLDYFYDEKQEFFCFQFTKCKSIN